MEASIDSLGNTRTSPEGPDVAERAASPAFMRRQCESLLAAGIKMELSHWDVRLARMAEATGYVADEIRRNHPTLDIPALTRRHHINAGGVDRMQHLRRALRGKGAQELARMEAELLVLSVVLDAGAGHDWRYRDGTTGMTFSRSEGLAVASFDLYSTGYFSSRKERPLHADADGLQRLSAAGLSSVLQVSAGNPIVGLTGRALALNALGAAIRQQPHVFPDQRLGQVFDALVAMAGPEGRVEARDVFQFLRRTFATVWPGRTHAGGLGLGDAWHHPQAGGEGALKGLVPLHQLTLWLTYSLFLLLEENGVRVRNVDELPGFPDYRSGGLLVDLGVLVPKDPALLARGDWHVGDVAVVEWRALTVALLDRLAASVGESLGLGPKGLGMSRLLQGGSWSAGRRLAHERRPDGAPPFRVPSDGIFF